MDALRLRIRNSESEDFENLAIDIVSEVLSTQKDTAAQWIECYGNPLRDPISGVILAHQFSFDGSVILGSLLSNETLVKKNARLELAKEILLLLAAAIIAFPRDGSDHSRPN